MKRSLVVSAGLVTVLLLSACDAPGDIGHRVLGTWGDASQSSQPSLGFSQDGKVTGTDGCNRLSGSWTNDEDEISLGPLTSTLMVCEGVDTWLGTGVSAKVDDSRLHIFNSAGTEIGTLQR